MRNKRHAMLGLLLAIGVQPIGISIANADESAGEFSSDPSATRPLPPPPILVAPAPPPSGHRGISRALEPLTSPGSWITERDYPAVAVRQGLEGRTGITVAVNPDGTVRRCEVVMSSGSPVLDATACALVKERARFRPALDDEGRPTTGGYSTTVVWVKPPPENISEDGHPLGRIEDGRLSFSFIVGVDGSVSDCLTIESIGQFPDQGFCPSRDERFQPILDEQGAAVRKRVTTTLSIEIRDPEP